MPEFSKSRTAIFTIIGLLFISAGIVFNEWLLAALFSFDGVIALPHRTIIWSVDLFLITIGLLVTLYGASLKKEMLFILAGFLFIAAGFLCNDWYLSILIKTNLSSSKRIIIRVFDLILISSGLTMVLGGYRFRQSVKYRGWISLAGILILFILYDIFHAYLLITYTRSTHKPASHSYNIRDDHLGWKTKPDSKGVHVLEGDGNYDVTYEIDGNGFRKINNTENPDFNIYFIGDSFTFGWGVNNENTFSNIIKDKYLKKEINIYNSGVIAYGMVQMYQNFLMNIEHRIQPHDIVIFTPLSADIRRNIKDFYFPYFLLYTNSEPVVNFPFFDNGHVRPFKMTKNPPNLFKLLFFSAPFTGSLWRSLHKKCIPDTTRESMQMIKRIKQKTESRSGKFVLIFLPHPDECIRGRYHVDISGFEYLDIMRYFPSTNEGMDRLVFRNDDHWNDRGHEIAAGAIVETLVSKNIIDEEHVRKN